MMKKQDLPKEKSVILTDANGELICEFDIRADVDMAVVDREIEKLIVCNKWHTNSR